MAISDLKEIICPKCNKKELIERTAAIEGERTTWWIVKCACGMFSRIPYSTSDTLYNKED